MRAVDSDKDAHPALNKQADSCSSCEALPKYSQIKTGQWGFGGFHKHCFPSGCVCQPLLYQEGLLLLILTFKSLSLTSVCTDPGVHFTAGTADWKQFNVQYLVGKLRMHLWTAAARQCLRVAARWQLILSEIHISKVCVECKRVFTSCHFCTLITARGGATGGTLGSNQEEQSGRWCPCSSLVFSLLQTKTAFAHNYKYLLNCNLTSIWLLSSK